MKIILKGITIQWANVLETLQTSMMDMKSNQANFWIKLYTEARKIQGLPILRSSARQAKY